MQIRHFASGLAMLACAGHASAAQAGACPPRGYAEPALQQLKASGFELEDSAERNALAVSLLSCVGDPDPRLRDGVAYEGLAHWLRNEALAADTVDRLYRGLLEQVEAPPDAAGFRRPFAALILSEVARVDRVQARFADARRAELVDVAARYLEGVADYRGFSDTEGWRHGVAHGADLVLQLILNPNIDARQVSRLLDAVAVQVSPMAGHFYIYGEPSRLARPVFYAYRRSLHDEGYWRGWLADLTDPAPLGAWSEAYASNAGLARRHNTLAFLGALHLYAASLEGTAGEPLAAWVMEALQRIQ